MQPNEFVRPVVRWYAAHARDLPWRTDPPDPWAVLVSEFMLQQTPVERVRPTFSEWLQRWPTPAALAREPAGEAVRAWGRLGYPRRALRLHAAARVIVDEHGGAVPRQPDVLLTLPGVGDYTAAAVAAFAYGARVAVLDTNVRRVHARWWDAEAFPRSTTPTARERARALDALPARGAATASVAVMELGAVICTARNPRCAECPVATSCAWFAAGRPSWDGPARRGQRFAGTDRQCRGALLAVLRERSDAVTLADLRDAWPTDDAQRMRALDGLVSDGLVVPLPRNGFSLPS